jgi:hypothetical protein
MSQELAAPPGAWSDTSKSLASLLQVSVVAEADLRKLMHDPIELFFRVLRPVTGDSNWRDALLGFYGAENTGAERVVRAIC